MKYEMLEKMLGKKKWLVMHKDWCIRTVISDLIGKKWMEIAYKQIEK